MQQQQPHKNTPADNSWKRCVARGDLFLSGCHWRDSLSSSSSKHRLTVTVATRQGNSGSGSLHSRFRGNALYNEGWKCRRRPLVLSLWFKSKPSCTVVPAGNIAHLRKAWVISVRVADLRTPRTYRSHATHSSMGTPQRTQQRLCLITTALRRLKKY